MKTLQPEDVLICKKIHEYHGKSYAFATRLFPKHLRDATHVLYAFFRVPDEIVDSSPNQSHQEKQKALNAFIKEWDDAYEKQTSSHPVLRATSAVFHTYHIPKTYAEDFLHAMEQDLSVCRYETYADLEQYMYGSAAVVGLMMTYVIGYKDPTALEYAKKLGYAMQLTNFLRDIKEDFETRGRIYLPLEDLRKHHVTESDIAHQRMSENMTALLKEEIARADALYQEATLGIALLEKRGRFAVLLASRLYQEILRKIEQQNYNIFTSRAKTSFTEKIRILISLWTTSKTKK
jgi:phytoene synthase